MPAGNFNPSGSASLDSWSCCQLLGGGENSRSNPRVAVSCQVDVVTVREPLQTGKPVRLSVGSLPEALHDVDDLVVSYACAIE